MSSTMDWVVARKKGSAWGTAVAVGALSGVKIESEGIPPGIPEPIVDANVGDVLAQGNYQGNVSLEGPVVVPVRYLGFERDLALFMGQDTVTQVAGETIAYQHEMIFQASIASLFATWVMNKGLGNTRLHEYPSCKYGSLDLMHGEGKLKASIGLIADRCVRASGVNGATEMNAVTYPTTALLALFNHLTLKLKAVTGTEGNLAPGDEYKVTDAKLTCNRNVSGDHESGSQMGHPGPPGQAGSPGAS